MPPRRACHTGRAAKRTLPNDLSPTDFRSDATHQLKLKPLPRYCGYGHIPAFSHSDRFPAASCFVLERRVWLALRELYTAAECVTTVLMKDQLDLIFWFCTVLYFCHWNGRRAWTWMGTSLSLCGVFSTGRRFPRLMEGGGSRSGPSPVKFPDPHPPVTPLSPHFQKRVRLRRSTFTVPWTERR